MKLSEMRKNYKPVEDQPKMDTWSEICKEIYENHYDVLERKCRKVFVKNNYMDKEDIIHDVLCGAVLDFEQRSKRGADLHSTKGLKISNDYNVERCIIEGVSKVIQKDADMRNQPHIRGADGKNYLSHVVILEEPVNSSISDDKWKDIIEDNSFRETVDKLIYEEYIEELMDYIEDFQMIEKSSKKRNLHSLKNLKKIAIMLLEGNSAKEIERELGVSSVDISRVRKNVLIAFALLIVDEELYYEKYLPLLSESAKKIINSRKKS